MPEHDDTSGTAELAREIAEEIVERVMAQSRRVEMAGRRVNIKPRRPAGYTYVYLDQLVGLGLSAIEWDVLFLLASRADHKGLIVYSASEICQALTLAPSQFHRHLRRVLSAGPLERVGRGALRLNPRVLWHGSSATQVTLLSEQLAAQLRGQWEAGGYDPAHDGSSH